jgi:DNA modification methylase
MKLSKIAWEDCKVMLGNLKEWPDNPALISEKEAERLMDSYQSFGQAHVFLIDPQNTIIDGHQRKNVWIRKLGADFVVDCRRASRKLTDAERRKIAVYLRSGAVGHYDWDKLANWDGFELSSWGFDTDLLKTWRFDIAALDNYLKSEQEPTEEEARKTLAERFGVPPFSVLDARQGYWQARKAAWIGLGIEGEVGRVVEADEDEHKWNSGTLKFSQACAIPKGGRPPEEDTNISTFDPVLCELAYRWFCPPLGVILDPFAGGSVRGIIATYLAYHYIGIDLRHEQIEANEKQAKEIIPDRLPVWMEGDSRNLSTMLNTQFDFIFSCPPYFDLEVYSDDKKDLSNTGDYAAFLKDYRDIISQCVGLLRENRFACFVVGDIRDKKGFYRNFPADTIAAFQDAGAILYNEAILVTAVGSLPIRIGKQFQGYRKLGKTHQNVLVFYKGNPKAIKEFGEIDISLEPDTLPALEIKRIE